MSNNQRLHDIWQIGGLPLEALRYASLTGSDPVFASSFAVGAEAQTSIAAAALAACELAHLRGCPRQHISVDMLHAAIECSGWFSLDGRVPNLWDDFSGMYRCADGYVRVHANFTHHREGALRLLGLSPVTATRSDAESAMLQWRALDFEQAAAERGLVATALRSFEQWDATPQAQAVSSQPLMTVVKIGDAAPLQLPPLTANHQPLAGIRVLDLTRILAGPVAGRALAAQGADVLLINSPSLPNIEAIADTSRGKRSAHLDLHSEQGRKTLWRLIDGANVFSQSYRPGGLQALGFSPEALAERRPGMVYVSLTAYGTQGPWADRRGFDSLVQTAMGFNHAEGESAGDGVPRAFPMQILDQASGYLMAFGAAAALCKQQAEGGSWHVQVSLAQTGHWLRSMGRIANGLRTDKPAFEDYLERSASGFGDLRAVRPSARLARNQPGYTLPSMPPGSAEPYW